MSEYQHKSVLLEEVIQFLQPQPGQHFIDGTLGGGGHTAEILQHTGPDGKVLAFELDQRAIKAAQAKLKQYQSRLFIVNTSYVDLQSEWKKFQDKLPQIQGMVLDLGLSSDQLDKADRGFSFKDTGSLDMRFDPQHQKLTAEEIILTWPLDKLIKILREYGEEPKARRLATGIIKYRSSWTKQKQKITTSMFVSVILEILNIKSTGLARFKTHPATRVFQALRIAVNEELSNVTKILPAAMKILPTGGKLVVISFHSLEDRIVKHFFKDQARGCICPPNVPVCVCDHQPRVKILTKKGIKPTAAEIKRNSRSRSAILRAIQKI
jgi:16S rRNA (cytosine1402-N4)-methyltransferase